MTGCNATTAQVQAYVQSIVAPGMYSRRAAVTTPVV